MRKFLLTAIVAMLTLNLFAQVKVSARFGFSNAWVQADSVFLGADSSSLSLTNLNGGYHFGLAAQLKIKKFFIQPEILFNTNTADFELSKDGAKSALSDRYNHMDIPVLIGYKAGSVRLGAGPVGHVFINNKSQLLKEDGFKDAFDKMKFGYIAGFGLDLWKVQIDLKYEGNLDDFDNFINFEGMDVNLADSPQRLIFTLGYIF